MPGGGENLRLTRGSALGATYEIGPFRLDVEAKAITHAGEPVPLGPRAVSVFSLLVESPHEYVSKTRLMDEAWPGLVVEEANLTVQISAIRHALARFPGGEHWIETLARRGYRFVGPVTRLSDRASAGESSRPRSNLPDLLTSFVGRGQELQELTRLLDEYRLLTLTGSGGVGKSRLALRLAATVMNDYRDGEWLVELAALSDPTLVPQTVGAVLGLKDPRDMSATERLTAFLQSRRTLLMLDNVEHVISACADLADAVLRQCPDVKLLVTSRERLGLSGEFAYRVPSLSLPLADDRATARGLAECESVALFGERVRLHRPQFAVTDKNAAAVASICRRLDGIPLAIELAAARVRALSVEEVDKRLKQGFSLLTGGSRTALPRQQTLRAAIDWSYNLLSDPEKVLLCRVSIFAGGWTLKAAEQVCADDTVPAAAVVDLLTSLMDKSLVVAEERSGTTRYRLLETVRQYARDLLLEHGGEGQWRNRHLAYFLALAREVEPLLKGAEVESGLNALQADHDNLRLALDWAESASGDAISGLRIAAAIWWFWNVRGYLREGRQRLSRLLAAVPDTEALDDRAKALRGAGALARVQADYDAAEALQRQSLAIRRRLGDQRGIAMTLGSLGTIAEQRGDYETARALQEESLAIQRGLGDRASAAMMLSNVGEVYLRQRDYGTARLRLEEALAIYKELGNQWGMAQCFNNLGRLATVEGQYESALGLLKQALLIVRDLHDLASITFSLQAVGHLAFARRSPLDAARIWGRLELLREEIDAPIPDNDRVEYTERVASARAATGDDSVFDRAWLDGRAMKLEQVIEWVLSTPHPSRTDKEGLSDGRGR